MEVFFNTYYVRIYSFCFRMRARRCCYHVHFPMWMSVAGHVDCNSKTFCSRRGNCYVICKQAFFPQKNAVLQVSKLLTDDKNKTNLPIFMISAPHYPNGLPTVATVVLLKLKGQVGFNYLRIDQNFSCQLRSLRRVRGFN